MQRGAGHRNVDRVGDLPWPAHDASPAERCGVPHGHAPVAVVGDEDAAGGEGEPSRAEHLAVLEAAAAHGVDQCEVLQTELQQPARGVGHVQALVVVGERRREVEEAGLGQAVLVPARRAAQLRQALPVADLDAVVLRVGHRQALESGQWLGQWQDATRVVELAGLLARLTKAALPAKRGPGLNESFRLPRGERVIAKGAVMRLAMVRGAAVTSSRQVLLTGATRAAVRRDWGRKEMMSERRSAQVITLFAAQQVPRFCARRRSNRRTSMQLCRSHCTRRGTGCVALGQERRRLARRRVSSLVYEVFGLALSCIS